MRSLNIRYLPAVDHLRAFAALLIVYYHGLHLFTFQSRFGDRLFGIDDWLQPSNPLLAALAEGHTAVSLFMVLSGFILTLGSLDRDVVWHRFIRNRLLRTYPLFLLLLFTAACASPEAFTFRGFAQSALGLANMPGALDAPPLTGLLWTIAVEWQFYVVFPFLLVMLRPDWTRNLLGLLAVLTALRALAIASGGNAQFLGYFTILGRMDQFLIGMWAAWCYQRFPLGRLSSGLMAAVALVVAVFALWRFNVAGGWPLQAAWKGWWATLEGVIWAAFILGYVGLVREGRQWWARVTAWVGMISYSIYLTHFAIIWPLVRRAGPFVFTGRHTIDALLVTTLLVVPATLAVAALTYRYVEAPFLAMRGRYHPVQEQAAP